MAKNKTIETELSVAAYVSAITDEKKRSDVSDIIKLYQKQSGLEPKMWGTGIVGFGSYHYKYESGHEGDAPRAALAARVNAIVLYLALSTDQREELLPQFGKHKTSKGCIYIKKLEDIDTRVLAKMITCSMNYNRP